MVGVAAFTVPTPDFGPVILTMPLWSLILLHYWRAVGENRRGYWLVLAIEIGLLLLTTYVGLILVGLLVLFTVGHPRARTRPALDRSVDRGGRRRHRDAAASGLAGGFLRAACMPVLARLRSPEAVTENFIGWLRQIALILTAHAGLVDPGRRWWRDGRGREDEPAPVIVRPAGRSVRPPVRLFLRDPAGICRNARGGAHRRDGTGRRRRAAGGAVGPWQW